MSNIEIPIDRSLIDRCEALLETKDKLSSNLTEMEFYTTKEAEAVEQMNEEKIISALNSNVKLGCLQSIFEKVHRQISSFTL